MSTRAATLVAVLPVLVLAASPSAWASAAGPFPMIAVVGADCVPVGAIAPGDALRITYQDVAQSCALGLCSVIFDRALDAGGITVRDDAAALDGRFVPTGESCGAHPVWRFDGVLPAGGNLFLVDGPNTTQVRIAAPEGKPPVAAPGPAAKPGPDAPRSDAPAPAHAP